MFPRVSSCVGHYFLSMLYAVLFLLYFWMKRGRESLVLSIPGFLAGGHSSRAVPETFLCMYVGERSSKWRDWLNFFVIVSLFKEITEQYISFSLYNSYVCASLFQCFRAAPHFPLCYTSSCSRDMALRLGSWTISYIRACCAPGNTQGFPQLAWPL